MSLFHNEFVKRDEVVFVTYEDVIKNPYPYLLNKIRNSLYEYYKDFLHIEYFKDLNEENLLSFCIQRSDIDIFKYLEKGEFDTIGGLFELKNRYMDLYKESQLLEVGKQLKFTKGQKFCKKIYVYSPRYDTRIHMDIQDIFEGDMETVNYVTGDFVKVINDLNGITAYIVNDLDYVIDIFEQKKAEYCDIMLASYGYNFIYNEDKDINELRVETDPYTKDVTCNFSMFDPIKYTEANVIQLINKFKQDDE